jgi:hypothetical protein
MATNSHQEDIRILILIYIFSLLLSSLRLILTIITEYTFTRLHSSELLYSYYIRVVGGRTLTISLLVNHYIIMILLQKSSNYT